MKRQNIILLGLLGLVLVGGATALFGLPAAIRVRAFQHRAQGIADTRAGKYDEGADLLGRYLARYPNDIEAQSYFVKARELAPLPNGMHLAMTINALKTLLQLDPTRTDDREHLMALYARLERDPEAIDTANYVITKDHRSNAHVRQVLTQSLMHLHRNHEALDSAMEWMKLAPLDVDAHLARLKLRKDAGQPAQDIIDDAQRLRAAHPNDARFELVQGYAYIQAGDNNQAADWLKTAAKHAKPTDDWAKILIAQLDGLGLSQDSLALLKDWVKAGADADVRHLLARRDWEDGDWAQAVEMLGDVDPANPQSDATLAAIKTIAQFNLGKKDDAAKSRAALTSRKDPAAKAWATLLPRLLDNAAVDDKQVIANCVSALAADPQNAFLDFYQGDARARLGDVDLAVYAWSRALNEEPDWSLPGVRLVEALLQKGRSADAIKVAQYSAQRNPRNASSVITLARAWEADLEAGGTGHADELLTLVDQIQHELPGEERTLLIRLQLLVQKGQKQDAIDFARASMARTPAPSEQVFLNIVSISRRAGLGLEREAFAACEKAHGNTPALAYTRAIDQFLGGHADAGLQLYDQLAQQGGKSNDMTWRLFRAQYLDIIGNKEAKAAWAALGDAYPNDLNVQQTISNARSARGDWDLMSKTIDRLKTLTGPKGLAWRLARARLMVEAPRNDADVEQGSVLLNQILQESRENNNLTEPHVLLARALVRLKRMDAAVEQLTIASQIDTKSVPIALQLAALLQSRGDFERVRQELDRIAPDVHSADQRREAAALLANQGNDDKAVQLLQQDQGPDTAAQEDLLLGVLYARRHQFDKANAIAEKLLLKPDLAGVQFATTLYAAQGKRAEAEKALSLLDGMKLDPGIKELAVGSYRAQIGDLPEAIKHYRAATEQAPTNSAAWRILMTADLAAGQVDDAFSALAKAAQAVPTDKAFASLQQQASLLKQSATDANLRGVVLGLFRDPSNSEAPLDLLRTLSEERQSFDMQRLASRLQQLVERHPEYLPAREQLADTLWAMGRRTDALESMRRAMNLYPTDPEPARVVTRLCYLAGDWQQMQTAADAWKKRSPNNSADADLAMAQAQLGQGRYDAAATQVEPYIAAAKAEPDKHVDLLVTYCMASANAGRPQTAADLLWPLAEKNDAWRARWVQVAINITDAAQSKAWFDRLAAATPADAIMTRVMIAEGYERAATRLNDADLQAWAADQFNKIVAAPNVTPTALISAGSYFERHNNPAGAEPLYRRAIAMDPTSFVANNNLAMLLASNGGNIHEAEQYATAAVRAQPRAATVHDTLAQVALKAGNAKNAADAERAATLLEPDQPTWRVRLAQCQLASGDVVGAQRTIQDLDSGKYNLQSLSPAVSKQFDALRKQLKDTRLSRT